MLEVENFHDSAQHCFELAKKRSSDSWKRILPWKHSNC